jgi:hypothetical protein
LHDGRDPRKQRPRPPGRATGLNGGGVLSPKWIQLGVKPDSLAEPHHELFELLVGQLWVKSADYLFELLQALALLAIRCVGRVVGRHSGASFKAR